MVKRHCNYLFTGNLELLREISKQSTIPLMRPASSREKKKQNTIEILQDLPQSSDETFEIVAGFDSYDGVKLTIKKDTKTGLFYKQDKSDPKI